MSGRTYCAVLAAAAAAAALSVCFVFFFSLFLLDIRTRIDIILRVNFSPFLITLAAAAAAAAALLLCRAHYGKFIGTLCLA